MFYFLFGVVCGPWGFGLVRVDAVEEAALLEHLAEIAVIVSLFTAGLKLRPPITDRKWFIAARLAFVSMTVTVGLIACSLVLFLQVHWGAAILIGAILAPTDPVLASTVQLHRPSDQNSLRFSLTAEAGLNDGTAFPFVMLGLGLLGLHDTGENGWRWATVDVVWATGAGLGIGWALGRAAGELVLYLRKRHREGFGYDEFLALGLIAISYGFTGTVSANGFLAVFAAGVALRSTERRHSEAIAASEPEIDDDEIEDESSNLHPALNPRRAPAHLTDALLEFNEQIERLIEVALVLCLGIMLTPEHLPVEAFWFIPLLLFVIRPLAVAAGLVGAPVSLRGKALISWLGIRGIGSFYYLMHTIGYGISENFSRQLISLVVWCIAVSIFLHGITATPLMRYAERKH